MKKLSIFAVLLLVLALPGAAVSALAAEEGAKKSEAPKKEGHEKGGGEEGKKESSKDISGGKFLGDPVYVRLAPMVVPVITDNGAEQIVTIQIDIEVKDFDVADALHSNMPRVMDALMQALYGGFSQGTLRNGQMLDVVKIKAKTTAVLQQVLSSTTPDAIRNVLIEGVAQRRL